jgi:hypothetical protein
MDKYELRKCGKLKLAPDQFRHLPDNQVINSGGKKDVENAGMRYIHKEKCQTNSDKLRFQFECFPPVWKANVVIRRER